MSSRANELMSEDQVVRLLGRERFQRLRAGGYVIPTRKGGGKYLKHYVEFRLNEDRRLGGGPTALVQKGYGRKDWSQADIEGGGGPPGAGSGYDPVRAEIANRYDQLERLRDLYDGKPGRGRIDPRVLVDLYRHAKSEADYLDQLGDRYGNTFADYRRQAVGARMGQLRSLFAEHAPGEDLDKCCLKYEQDQGGGMDPEIGEAGLVSTGRQVGEAVRLKLLETVAVLQGAGYLPRQVSPTVERKLDETVAKLRRHGINV